MSLFTSTLAVGPEATTRRGGCPRWVSPPWGPSRSRDIALACPASPLPGCILLMMGCLALAGEGQNLVPNGDFERGKGHPAQWDRVDGLCTFWVEDPIRGGKCLMCDSDVLASEYRARREEMKLPAPPPARRKTPVQPPGYDAVGGIEGVTYWSDWIDLKPRMRYRLSVDYRTDAEFEGKGLTPKVFVKSYAEVAEEVFEDGKTLDKTYRRVFWKMYKDCKDSTAEWQTATLEFNPTLMMLERKRLHPGVAVPELKWMRVMILAYWPRGTYYFDNVRMEEIGLDRSAAGEPEGEVVGDEEPVEGPADAEGPEVVPPK